MDSPPSSSSSSPSGVFQQTYLRTLLPALSRIHHLHGSFPSLGDRCRATKFAVDMSLAISAGGNLRWKKALAEELMIACESTKRIRSLRRRRRRRRKRSAHGGETSSTSSNFSEEEEAEGSRSKRRRRRKWEKISQAEAEAGEEEESSSEQMRSLGGLIPGGRHMDIPLLLEETAHYLVSLKLQVEALESLASSSIFQASAIDPSAHLPPHSSIAQLS